MKIYPKLSYQDFDEEMKQIVLQSEGIELQFFDENGITSEFNFSDEIRKRKKEFPHLKEIVVHPPLNDYNIEHIILKDSKIIENQLKELVKLSEELDIKLAINYHTYWTKDQYVSTGLDKKIKELLKIIEGTKVVLLIENLFMILDGRIGCPALEICKEINHPNLRTCIDTTHVHCKSNIWEIDFEKMINQDFNPDDCEKFVKQIHFAACLNNDGYIQKGTHGRVHPSEEELKKEVEWLKRYKMENKIFVTEVSEEDYYSRVDQIKEIKMLEKINQEE